jgi:hypothetical protein
MVWLLYQMFLCRVRQRVRSAAIEQDNALVTALVS